MQRVFNDPTDKGKLYINYPMVESYKHFKCLPDPGYYDRTMDIDYTKGNVYKNKVKKESAIQKYFDFPKKMDKALKDRYEVEDKKSRKGCCKSIMDMNLSADYHDSVHDILESTVPEEHLETACHQFMNWLHEFSGKATYREILQEVFVIIIKQNIEKAIILGRTNR